jgi:hypothetical protein
MREISGWKWSSNVIDVYLISKRKRKGSEVD